MVYNPVGAANGLFAPPHTPGNPQAVAAADTWNANRYAQLHPAVPPDPVGTINPNTGELYKTAVPPLTTTPAPPTSTGPATFAPAYIPGNQQSAGALAAWNAINRPPPATTPPGTPPATPPGAGGPSPLPGKLGSLPAALQQYFQPLTDRFAANNRTGFSPEAFAKYMSPLTSRFPQGPGGSYTFTEPTLPPAQGQAPSARDRIAQALMSKRG